MVVSIELPRDQSEGVFFFESTRSFSEAGAALARAISERIELPTEGRATVILKETRAPAAVLCLKDMDAEVAAALVEGLVDFFRTDHGVTKSVR